jgi:hypothetical protein
VGVSAKSAAACERKCVFAQKLLVYLFCKLEGMWLHKKCLHKGQHIYIQKTSLTRVLQKRRVTGDARAFFVPLLLLLLLLLPLPDTAAAASHRGWPSRRHDERSRRARRKQ